jgi:hypothetical protein
LKGRLGREQKLITHGSIETIHTSNTLDIDRWIEKDLKNIEYDLTILNNNLEESYAELRDYCLSVYWKDFGQ